MRTFTYLIASFLLLVIHSISAQDTISSKVTEATVYLRGAQVVSNINLSHGQGQLHYVIDNLSPQIDASSIKIEGLGNLEISNFYFSNSYITKPIDSEQVGMLRSQKEALEIRITEHQSEITGLKEERTLLNNNNGRLAGEQDNITMEQIKAVGNYLNNRHAAISNEIAEHNRKLQDLNEELRDLENEIRRLTSDRKEQRGILDLKLNSTRVGRKTIKLTYVINNAGWNPTYALTARNTSADISLKFKAQVYQNTGVSWNDIDLTLATGDPLMQNDMREIVPKYLRLVNRNYGSSRVRTGNFKYNPQVKQVSGTVTTADGEPALGVTVLIKGTSVGTTTDFDGRYSLDVPRGKELVFSGIEYETYEVPIYASIINVALNSSMNELQEVVITGYATDRRSMEASSSQVTEEIENITSRSYVIKGKQTITSDSEAKGIEIKEVSLDTEYEYYTAPVLQEQVFLTAQLKNWEQYDLLPGEAQVYFDGAYNGKVYFDPTVTTELLRVSLGVDPQIIVTRKELSDFKSTSFFGGNKVLDKKYELTIKNNRQNSITVKMQDRIPISQNEEIKVKYEEVGDATLNEEKKILTWMLEMPSGRETKKRFGYQIRYPKDQSINLR